MKTKKIILVIFCFSLLGLANAQTWQWSKHIGSINSTSSDVVQSVVTDINNNVYVSGYYYGAHCYFDNDTLNNNGYNNMFLAKYDTYGVEQWVRGFGGNNPNTEVEGCVIAYDSINNYLYLAGEFYSTCTFGSIHLTSAGYSDIFIAKYDLSGNCIWAKSAGSIYDDGASDIIVSQNGSVYIIGYTQATATFDAISVDKGTFIAKYDSSGNCIWAKKKFNTITTYPYTEVSPYYLGSYNNDIFFGGTCYVDTLTTDTVTIFNAHKHSILIARFDSTGTAKWMITAAGPTAAIAGNILVDNNCNIYTSGSFSPPIGFFGTDTINSSGLVYFIAKYDSLGHLIWVRQDDMCGSMALDRDSGFYVTGGFSGTVTIGSFTISTSNTSDMFVAKYNDAGNCVGVIHDGNAGGSPISIDYNNNIIAAGTFAGTINFGSNPSMTSYGGAYNIYLAKSTAITGMVDDSRVANNQLYIYANPNKGICDVTIPDDFQNEKNLMLNIYSSDGKLIQQVPVAMRQGKITLNIEAQAQGIYNVTLCNATKCYNGRIVFE